MTTRWRCIIASHYETLSHALDVGVYTVQPQGYLGMKEASLPKTSFDLTVNLLEVGYLGQS
jgi:hypothetical protein